jgi:uncharacterized protein YgbK (DUF1537 family)
MSTLKTIIIADDLTGACDTAMVLGADYHQTQISLDSSNWSDDALQTLSAISLHTRNAICPLLKPLSG